MFIKEYVTNISFIKNLEMRKVICHQVKFLKEQHPSYQLWFFLLGENLFQCHMIIVNSNLILQDVGLKLL